MGPSSCLRQIAVSLASLLLAVPLAGQGIGDVASDSVRPVASAHWAETTRLARTIRADSVVPTAPVFQLTDLLTGRLAGVEVQSIGGQSGSGARIIIRGGGSVYNGSDPVVYVDGVRVASDPGGTNRSVHGLLGNAPHVGDLAELSPTDIQRIDVLTGPAATTEYGIDAVNGVVLVTTRRPSAGAPQWAFSSETGTLTVPAMNPYESYAAWGHAVGDTTRVLCGPSAQVAGTCILDSLTHFSPLATARTSPFTDGSQGAAALQVGGGLGSARYFAAGERQSERGVLEMPTPDAQIYTAQHGHAPPSGMTSPNGLDRTNVRASVTTPLPLIGEATIFGSAIGRGHRAANESLLAANVAAGSATIGSNDGWPGLINRPRYLFADEATDRTERYIGGASWAWTPWRWLSAHATGGFDKNNGRDQQHLDPADDPFSQLPGLFVRDRTASHTYSASASVSGTATIPGLLSTVTTVGAAYREVGFTTHSLVAINLLAGVSSPTVGSIEQTSFAAQDARQRGAFIDETVTILDRLALTAAVRRDRYQAPGAGSPSAAYPRFAASWSALHRGADQLRVHAAMGETGDIPPGNYYTPYNPAQIDGLNAITVQTTPHPALRPEHVREYEVGADVTAWQDRVTLSGSLYDKTTTDAYLPAVLGGNSGATVVTLNGGTIRNRGVELQVGATVVRTVPATWDVSLSGWANQNRLVSVTPQRPPQAYGSTPLFQAVPGHALYAIWEPTLTYRDSNGDGVIEPNEISLGPAVDQGSSLPTRGLSLQSTIGILRGHVRFGGLLDYEGGNRLIDQTAALQFATRRGANDRHAPLAEQAQTVAQLSGAYYAGPPQDASFLRLRELSLSYVASPALARTLHTGRATISLLARNLWLSTRYSGVDPEINRAAADPMSTLALVPQPRYFVLRLTLGY